MGSRRHRLYVVAVVIMILAGSFSVLATFLDIFWLAFHTGLSYSERGGRLVRTAVIGVITPGVLAWLVIAGRKELAHNTAKNALVIALTILICVTALFLCVPSLFSGMDYLSRPERV